MDNRISLIKPGMGEQLVWGRRVAQETWVLWESQEDTAQSWPADRGGTEAQNLGLTQTLPLVSWEPEDLSHLFYLPKCKFCTWSSTH